jgi:hypothetical protein
MLLEESICSPQTYFIILQKAKERLEIMRHSFKSKVTWEQENFISHQIQNGASDHKAYFVTCEKRIRTLDHLYVLRVRKLEHSIMS